MVPKDLCQHHQSPAAGLHAPKRSGLKSPTFRITVHGLKCFKHTYYYKCRVNPCNCSFSTVCDWNNHHRSFHSTYLMIHSLLTKTKCTWAPTKRHCSPTEAVLVGRSVALPGPSRIFKVHPHGVDAGDYNQG